MTATELENAESASGENANTAAAGQTAAPGAPGAPGQTAPGSGPAPAAPRRIRRTNLLRLVLRRSRFGLQSKILLALVLSSIVGVLVIGLVGGATGSRALRQVESDRLIELREGQKRAVLSTFREVTNSLIIYSETYGAVEGVAEFAAGFDDLAKETITPAQQQAIVTYYEDQMIGPMKKATGEQIDINAVLPSSNAQKYLQAHYTAAPTAGSPPPADAGDGSQWSAASRRFDFLLRDITIRFDYSDALLLDLRGNIVYSVARGPELGSNILTGPYRGSNLRDAYQKALASNDLNFVWITDFQPYQPHLGTPTAWVVSPIGQNGRIDGVMALPVPIAKINEIMTVNRKWTAAGMGASTETYLAGPDKLMRSDSRDFLEDPQTYRREVIAAGTPPDVADRAIRLGTTVLVQPVATDGLRAAQRGETGVMPATDYMGNKELEAYAPLTVPNSDLHWSILATRDNSAAFARLGHFSKGLAIAVTSMVFAICLIAMIIAQAAVKPVRRLQEGARKIASGDYDIKIPARARDEIGDLTRDFNDMARNLASKEELLNEQRRDKDRMLLTLMPESVAHRYRDGEANIAQRHQNVAIVYADVSGLDELSNDMPEDALVATVDDLFRQFDAAAESAGVERIRHVHTGYLASSGVVVPRLDGIHRSIAFALEAARIIDRFNRQTGHRLGLRVGVNTGEVVSGLVGSSSLVYDIWGGAVSMAFQMNRGAAQPGIYVGAQVYEAMRDVRQFAPAGTISVAGEDQPIYRLTEH